MLALWLLFGGALFQFCFLSKIYALDSGSQLFEQNQNVNPSQGKESQSLALPDETPNPSPSLFGTLVRLLVALIVIIGLILLTVWGLKVVWEKRGWNQFAEEGKPIKVLTSVYIAPRKAIYLVEVGNRILVIGSGNEEMNCLDVIHDIDEINFLRHSTLQGFPKIFDRISKRHEMEDHKVETQKIIKESKQVVGDYTTKLKGMKKKNVTSDPMDGES